MATCEYCGDSYVGKGGLRTHQVAAHEDEVTVVVSCNWCGEELEVAEWKTDENQYCDTICSKAWSRYLKQGERHPNYVDGSARTPDFQRIAFTIRQRDGECLRCGAEDGGSDGRELHVHHIIPEDERDNPHDRSCLVKREK